MRKSRRLAAALVVSALVAAGGITVGLVANANQQAPCPSAVTNGLITCTLPNSTNPDTTINTPSAIQAVVTLGSGSPAQFVLITYSVFCSQGGNSATTSNPTTNPALAIAVGSPVTVTLKLAYTNPDSCSVTNLTATLYTSAAATTASTSGSFEMLLDWTPAATPTPTATSSSPPPPPPTHHVSTIKGYGNKCLDAKGNSSANGTKVIIWSCNSSDSAQGWSYSSGELKHNGHCANIQGNGGSGSKLVLWTCNGASNERWFHTGSNGEFVSAGTAHGLLCVDDPGYSKTNGTQLTVYRCHNTANQHWS